MSWDKLLDEAQEEIGNKTAIGTTKRGIGPCYANKAFRKSIRFEDLTDKGRIREKMELIHPLQRKVIEDGFSKQLDEKEKLIREYSNLGQELKKYLGDVSLKVHTALEQNEKVLFEGAQGTFLDLNFGTYPYVTSSHPISGGIATGIGIAPTKIKEIIGVVKAYTTRVGNGPFPTELKGEKAENLREAGDEYGTTTGRPRRVGWLDLPMLKTSTRINGFTATAITKLDVLNGMKEIKICTGYKVGNKELSEWPSLTKDLSKIKPIYKKFPGFRIKGNEKKYEDLEKNAKSYLEFIEENLKVPIKLISIGPDRKETILK